MAEFSYRGVTKDGKKVSGTLEVNSEGDLRMALRAQGVRPTRISRGGGGLQLSLASISGGATSASVTVPVNIVILFTRQLQLLISSGIPLVQALEVLADQTSHKGMKGVITNIRDKVSSGSYLWEALSLYPRVFPKLFTALVRAGEASGAMEGILKRLSKYMEDEDRLRKMVKSAMMYPVIVSCIGVLVVALMLIFVIPKFEEMLKQANQELPLPTQFVINSSHFLINHIVWIIGGMIFAGYLFKRYLATSEGRAMKDRVVFSSPIFGVLSQKSGIARFSRTLQTLLGAGVNLLDAIEICKGAADNAVLEEAIAKIRSQVEAGKTLGMILNTMTVFPKMASQMIMVGESTGNLDKSLEKIADFYESDVEVFVSGISKLIEPFVLVFLGGAIGGMMIAMYLPIFKLAGGAGSE